MSSEIKSNGGNALMLPRSVPGQGDPTGCHGRLAHWLQQCLQSVLVQDVITLVAAYAKQHKLLVLNSTAGRTNVIELDPALGQAETVGEWAVSPSLCIAAAGAMLDGWVVTCGGQTGSTVRCNLTRIESVQTGSWLTMPIVPIAVASHAMVALNGCLYVFGNYTYADGDLSFCFDPQAQRWHELSSMRHCRSRPAGLAWNGKVWAIGGGGNMSIEVYDPTHADQGWTLQPAPWLGPSGDCIAVELNDLFYLFSSTRQLSCEVYDPTARAPVFAHNLRPIRQPRHPASRADRVVVIDERLILLHRHYMYVEVYNPRQDEWTTLKSSVRFTHAIALVV